MRLFLYALRVCVFLSTSYALAVEDTDVDFFEKRIRPVLVEHCYKCHSAESKKIRGGLLLDSRSRIRAGGDSGAGVVPGEPSESLLLDALRYEAFEMPPSGPLPDAIVADFEHWIRRGAVDPRAAKTDVEINPSIDLEAGRQFWCFQPVNATDPPRVRDRAWAESDIDLFLQAKREAEDLRCVDDADRATLARRAYFALIGLPPTPDQIAAFEDDPAPTRVAFSRLIDRLLESQHFGERWGRHWLDVVRFAESTGGGRTLLLPEAWRYRDYVIDALNEDMPYDQFLREQIAGDLLPADDWQTRRRQLTATAFLLLGPTNYELQDKEVLEMDIVDEQIDTIGKAFMGQTLGCARCHDHKFDPVPTADYYALAGILKSTRSVIHSNVSAWHTVNLPLPPKQEASLQQHEARVAELEKRLKQQKSQLNRLGGKSDAKAIDPRTLSGIVVDDVHAERVGAWKSSTFTKGYVGQGYIHDNGLRERVHSVTFAPRLPASGEYEVRVSYTPGRNRSKRVPIHIWHAAGETTRFIDQTTSPQVGSFQSLGRFSFEAESESRVVVSNEDAGDGVVIADAVQFIPDDQDLRGQPAEQQASQDDPQNDARKAIAKSIAKLEAQLKELIASGPQRPVVMAPIDEPNAADIHLAIRGVVHNQGPVVPRGALQVTGNPFAEIGQGQSGRVQLADWIADDSNPLTARVMVNRVWYWLFGEGLVRTVDNFGATGDRPSHPELLDYLAEQFIRDGWSIKRLVHRIMLSRTYRLSSSRNAEAEEFDPANRFLWRMNRRRLDAESIRDSLLHVSGTIDLSVGGPNIKPDTKIEYDYVFDSTRRSVYVPVFRNTLPEIFATFDFADPNIQGGRRTTSTIAPQALLLMNQPFVIQQTRNAAKRLLSDPAVADSGRINHCYRQVLGRNPTESEYNLASDFVAAGGDPHRWGLLYQTLFQSLDFRYVQ